MVVVDKKERSCKIIDFAVPVDSRIEEKEKDKIEKYQDLERELQKIWKVNPIQDGRFWDCSRIGGGGAFWPPFPKICHTYTTIMKPGTVIHYLRKIQKMYKSRDTSLDFC